MSNSLYEGITNVVEISSNIGRGCQHCDQFVGLEKFAESITHYITKHGYRLLHVGTQSELGDDGKPLHHTVAIVGK
ncbi:MAG TPA: hypothetical protein VN700_06490 [Vicinamibacterales bacterium]|nr:hypothetical protein [Vicinamibacterales bacterium]